MCPITQELMRQPAFVTASGLTYERTAIETWVRDHGTDPVDRSSVRLEDIVPNFGVRQMVEHFARTRLSAQEPPPRSHHIASGERGAVETDAGDDIAEIVERSAEEAATERFRDAEQRGDVFDLTGSHETTEGAPPQRQAQQRG